MEKSTKELFADWLNGTPDELQPTETPSYPSIRDGGEAYLTVSGTPKEQFAEWFSKRTAFNPKKKL